MPWMIDSINLSAELINVPINVLIVKTKALIKSRGYSQSTIYHFNERFNDLRKNADGFNVDHLSEEFIASFIKEGAYRSPKLTNSNVQRKSLLNLIAKAATCAPVFTFKKEADRIQTKSFRENLTAYKHYLMVQEKRKETIASYIQTTVNFLLYLEKINKTDFSDISAINIRDFLTELSTKWSARSMRIVPSQLKTYLKFAGAHTDAILFSCFRTPHRNNPVRAMSSENVEILWRYVENGIGDFRSKAIVAMLLSTGMRPVDITGLMLDDIDWRNDNIGFVQSKTGVYMNLELFPVIGSVIAKYIIEERPRGTGYKNVFLTTRAPYRRLSPSVCNRILKIALENDGVTYVGDGLYCPRAVRRSLVSRMIAKGIPIQKAAASIGHVDENSVELYTELDLEKMKSICLPIPTIMKGWRLING